MRDPFKVVVALTIVILGGLVLALLKRPDWVASVTPVLSSIVHNRQEMGRTISGENLKPAPNPLKRAKTRLDVQPADAGLADRVEISQSSNTAEVHKTFPIDWQIQKGIPQSSVLGTYGRPSLWVTIPNRGQLFQQFIYVDGSTGRKTFVSFTNSFVTGAQTSAN